MNKTDFVVNIEKIKLEINYILLNRLLILMIEQFYFAAGIFNILHTVLYLEYLWRLNYDFKVTPRDLLKMTNLCYEFQINTFVYINYGLAL